MCSTCNYKGFSKVFLNIRNKEVLKLQQTLGEENLVIGCDPDGTNYFLGIDGSLKGNFKIYKCPTCGRKLF